MTTLSVIAKNFNEQTFGELLGMLRQRKGLSARQLSLAAGMSPAYVSKIERGEYLPTIDKFAKIADCLDMKDAEVVFLVRMLS